MPYMGIFKFSCVRHYGGRRQPPCIYDLAPYLAMDVTLLAAD